MNFKNKPKNKTKPLYNYTCLKKQLKFSQSGKINLFINNNHIYRLRLFADTFI